MFEHRWAPSPYPRSLLRAAARVFRAGQELEARAPRFPRVRTTAVVSACIAGLLVHAETVRAQSQADQGEQIFQTLCVMCHTLGGGRLIGPDLQGIADRRSEDWIIRFVRASQQLVSEGDPDAVAVFEEYARVPMPDQALSDDEIRAVIAFTRQGESAGPAEVAEATEEQILLGQELFQGTSRFANGGPTCNGCHEVTNDAVIGGGILAIELTTVFSRLGGPGVRAILGSPPFPVMQRAYMDRPLTEEEIVALVGFLERADAEQALHEPRDYGIKLFGAGMIGVVILLGLYSVAWRGRKKGSVNQEIFDRQVKST